MPAYVQHRNIESRNRGPRYLRKCGARQCCGFLERQIMRLTFRIEGHQLAVLPGVFHQGRDGDCWPTVFRRTKTGRTAFRLDGIDCFSMNYSAWNIQSPKVPD
jgi:hypothetical protein